VQRELLEDLKQQIENGSAIVIAGTGVSLGASNLDRARGYYVELARNLGDEVGGRDGLKAVGQQIMRIPAP
jgi:hypothetical protein